MSREVAGPSPAGPPWTDPAGPLVTLGESLGLAATDWPRREEWRVVKIPEGPYSVSLLRRAADELAAACEAYGTALAVRLELVADDPEAEYPGLRWDLVLSGAETGDDGAASDPPAARLESYLSQYATFADEVEVRLEASLDKTVLAAQMLGPVLASALDPEVEVDATVVLFPEALGEWFHHLGGLPRLEDDDSMSVQGDDRRWLLLIPRWRSAEAPSQRLVSGPYLTLFGGDPRELPTDALAPPVPERAPFVAAQRRQHLRWDERWLTHLTPLHLQVRGAVPADDPVLAPLRWQAANLAVLFTADSARREAVDGGTRGEGGAAAKTAWLATFQGADRRLTMRLRDVGEAGKAAGLTVAELAGVEAWADLVHWVYAEERFTGDRLAVVQNVVCREAWHAGRDEAFAKVLTWMPAVLDQVQHSWKAFIEGKVDAFFTQAQSLEEHVAKTVGAFAEQTSALLKRLTETVLAAVGVVIAALVLPAIRSGESDPRVLWWSVLIYSAYVVVFPLLLGLTAQWQEHRELERGFEERYRRFERQLPAYLVADVGREPVERSLHRYRLWFWITVGAYLALLAALGVTLLGIGVRWLLG